MSFVSRDDILEVMSEFIHVLFKEVLGVDIGDVPVIPHREALDRCHP